MKLEIRNYTPYFLVLAIWGILLLFSHSHWSNFIYLLCGAAAGYLIMEINWLFPKKEIFKIIPLILLPITIFVLTSTAGALGKSLIVFLNLRLLLDKKSPVKDNQTSSL